MDNFRLQQKRGNITVRTWAVLMSVVDGLSNTQTRKLPLLSLLPLHLAKSTASSSAQKLNMTAVRSNGYLQIWRSTRMVTDNASPTQKHRNSFHSKSLRGNWRCTTILWTDLMCNTWDLVLLLRRKNANYVRNNIVENAETLTCRRLLIFHYFLRHC